MPHGRCTIDISLQKHCSCSECRHRAGQFQWKVPVAPLEGLGNFEFFCSIGFRVVGWMGLVLWGAGFQDIGCLGLLRWLQTFRKNTYKQVLSHATKPVLVGFKESLCTPTALSNPSTSETEMGQNFEPWSSSLESLYSQGSKLTTSCVSVSLSCFILDSTCLSFEVRQNHLRGPPGLVAPWSPRRQRSGTAPRDGGAGELEGSLWFFCAGSKGAIQRPYIGV